MSLKIFCNTLVGQSSEITNISHENNFISIISDTKILTNIKLQSFNN